MPEPQIEVPPLPTGQKERTDDEKKIAGVVRSLNSRRFAGEFLTPGKDIDESLVKGVIKEEEIGALCECLAFMITYHQEEKLLGQMLQKRLHISGAINGYNRSIASMTDIGIAILEGYGVPIDHKKAVEQMKAQGAANRGNATENRPNKD